VEGLVLLEIRAGKRKGLRKESLPSSSGKMLSEGGSLSCLPRPIDCVDGHRQYSNSIKAGSCPDQSSYRSVGSIEQNGTSPRGRVKGKSTQASRPRHRTLSAAARAKIAAAQRARWAKHRASATTTKTIRVKTKGRPPMSPAARKKLSVLMKARWAARKRARRQRAA
jgi:hypothetical protein